MKKTKALLILVIAIFQTTSTFAQKGNSEKLDAMIQKGITDWQIPGLVAVVVKEGDVVFQEAYGIKDIDTKEPVDDNTLFNMGSTTKAIIAISIGMLVDEGKLNWEDKVVDHLPSFQLSDPYITADARIKDLLTHNLGIGNADMLWILDTMSTEETIEKFKYAERAYPLRGGYTYQNIMYAIAGEVIKAASGKHWTTFVEEKVFKPLGMVRSQARSVDILKAGNYTTPHRKDYEDGLVRVGYNFQDQIGAAGMIWSCSSDIANYLKFLVNDGIYNSDTLLQPSTFKYLFKPHVLIPSGGFYPTQVLTKPNWMSYGLGWFQHDYRGSKLDYHTGSISGLIAIAGIMHEHNTAVYVLSNLDHAELRHAIMYKAMDLYAYNDDSRDWHSEVFDLYSGYREEAIQAAAKQKESRVPDTTPTLELEKYCGIYKHQMLGKIVVSLEGKNLNISINDHRVYSSKHWHYDTFMTEKDPTLLWELLITFQLDPSGKVGSLELLGENFQRRWEK